MSNKIIKRCYYAFEIETLSPLNTSSGLNINSDNDVFRNGLGEVVITGASLAGSFRSYLYDPGNRIKEQKFGIKDGDNRMSCFNISDLCLSEAKVVLRDNVSLTEKKTVDNKFDSEIVETGAKGFLYINYLIRENDKDINDFDSIINDIYCGINNGAIRLGRKKNRGFGLIKINSEKSYSKCFDMNSEKFNIEDYITFKSRYKDLELYDEYKPSISSDINKFASLSAKFNIPGGIIIRDYFAEKGEADYSHIKCNDKPIIPGTSFAGVIRKRAKEILVEIGYSNVDELINKWFGFADKNNSQQSNIIVSESIINGGKSLLRIRNSIDRFTGGTVDGALFNENVHYNGDVLLNILIRNNDNYQAIIGLLSLVIEDISKGYTTIGGESNIGYGLLESCEDIKCSEDLSICKQELFKLLNNKEVHNV